MNVIIIGSGIAGLSTSYLLKKVGIKSKIIESQDKPGGLSKSFEMAGEWFDLGGHASFAKDKFVREILEDGVEFHTQKAVAYNHKGGKWIKNPAQINLSALDTKEKIAILSDYFSRKRSGHPKNYMEWLENQYGIYFANNYPKLYTQKYWTVEPEQLETKWVGVRMYQPTTEEVLYGAFETNTEEVHYSGEIRYPKVGGFEKFIKHLEEVAEIKFEKHMKEVDTKNHRITYLDGDSDSYDILVNTAPLPEFVPIIRNVPDEVLNSSKRLNATSMILVSICLEGKLKTDISPGFYIYDSDIPATRVYSTTKYSGNYKGRTALQAEVFISKFRSLDRSLDEISDKVIRQLSYIGMYDLDKVIAKDVRFEKYANIIFTHDIYKNRDIVRKYLLGENVFCAGRFGEWDYFWTDQAMLSGKKVAEKIIEKLKGSD